MLRATRDLMNQQLRSWLAPRYVDILLNAATLAAAGVSVLAFLAVGKHGVKVAQVLDS